MKLPLIALGICASAAASLPVAFCRGCPVGFILVLAAINVTFVLGAALCAFAAIQPWFAPERVAAARRQGILLISVGLMFLVGMWRLLYPVIDL
jgi:CDP-diglyceride synthetase